MSRDYFDRNGKKIEPGMTIRNLVTGQIELVYECDNDDLGFSATNPAYRRNHPYAAEDVYFSLSNFANGWSKLREYEIVDKSEEKPWAKLTYPAAHFEFKGKRRRITETLMSGEEHTYTAQVIQQLTLADFEDYSLIQGIIEAAAADPEITDLKILDKKFILNALKKAIGEYQPEHNRVFEASTDDLRRELIRRPGVIYDRVGPNEERTYTTDGPAYFILIPY